MKTTRYSTDQGKDGGGGGVGGGDDHEMMANNSNQLTACFKLCCKKPSPFGLEDVFWLLFLIILIVLGILKATTRLGWGQMLYFGSGSLIVLIVIYLIATVINKFCFEDAATAHWNAHARFTQAALQARLHQEDHKVHVIAPPRMGGAKLNILYTVGDVPILATNRSISGSDVGANNQLRVTPSSSTTSSASIKHFQQTLKSVANASANANANTNTNTNANASVTAASNTKLEQDDNLENK